MRLTIIQDDRTVYFNNNVHNNVDLSGVPTNIHALQWYDSYGELEYKSIYNEGKISKQSNEMIQELPSWAQTIVESLGTE